MHHNLPRATVYCHAVRHVLHIVEKCSKVFEHCIRMLSIRAVMGSHEIRLRITLGAQGGSLNSNRREKFAGGSAVLPMLSEGLEIEHSDFDPRECDAEW